MKNVIPLLCILLLCCAFPRILFSQADTEFWFAAPDVDRDHGDTPIRLGLAATSEVAEVIISIPANPNFEPIIDTLSPNETKIIGLTSFLNELENQPPNTVLNKGLYITATTPIIAYYHAATPHNQDIYTLKGRQALGEEFYLPSQFTFRNVHGNSFCDIVATQDQTSISITPSKRIAGRSNRESFTVTLNRGETFTVRASGRTPGSQLAGTYIQSDKPIAVTKSDDSIVNEAGTGWDLCGDQIVPIQNLGTEYVAVRMNARTESLYITATENNTEIIPDGNPARSRTLDAGQSMEYRIRNATASIRSDHPVYVWHLSGGGNEPAGALIPPIGCSGMTRANFIRPTTFNFSLLLLTEKGNEDAFKLNGTDISPGLFRTATGAGDWVAARINNNQVSLESFNTLTNAKGLFQFGIIMDAGPGAAYGYFSNYNSLALGDSETLCENDTITLDASPFMDEYLWNTGSTEPSIEVDQGGTYWVSTKFQGCEFSDTIQVKEEIVSVDLGPDQSLCIGDTLMLSVDNDNASLLWENATTKPERMITEGGEYSVRLSRNGCPVFDTLMVNQIDIPRLELGPDTLICTNEEIDLKVEWPGAQYLWQDGSTNGTLAVASAGTYSVVREFQGCIQEDTIEVSLREAVLPSFNDTTICEGDTILYNIRVDGNQYTWDDGTTTPLRRISEENLYTLEVANRCGISQQIWWVYREDCSCKAFIPNVFSPNNDGIHDVFKPSLSCDPAIYDLTVFDRWGNMLFESNDIRVQWDGTSGQEDLPEGVYYWRLRYYFENNEEIEPIVQKGHVTILR